MEDKGGKEFVSDQTFHKCLFLQIVLLCFFSLWDLIVIDGRQHGLPVHETSVAKFSALWTGQFLYMMADLS